MPGQRVAVLGVGHTAFIPLSPALSYKELMYEAALKAYADANIDPRTDVGSFVTVAEDFHEGTSIFDEYVPDQLGAKQRPVQTICGNGLHGLITAAMTISSGAAEIAVIEGHSKASNILTPDEIAAFAMDPIHNRPLAVNPIFVAGLEMRRYMHDSGTTLEQCAAVVVKNRRQALRNPAAAYGQALDIDAVLQSAVLADPLTAACAAQPADGCIVMVLGVQARAVGDRRAVWLRGMGYANGSYALETRDWGSAFSAQRAAQMAYSQAGIARPADELDLVEVDDTFAYKELQHLEATGLVEPGQAGRLTLAGETAADGRLPVNVSGGALGQGHLLEATGLARALEIVLQLRGQAGPRQLERASTGMALAWRGVPVDASACVILGREV
jgi:acetyl-CoA C-acetyltransferase